MKTLAQVLAALCVPVCERSDIVCDTPRATRRSTRGYARRSEASRVQLRFHNRQSPVFWEFILTYSWAGPSPEEAALAAVVPGCGKGAELIGKLVKWCARGNPRAPPRVADGRVFRGPPHLGQRVSKLIPAGAFIYILSHQDKTQRHRADSTPDQRRPAALSTCACRGGS